MTEPHNGSDAASIRTRAVRDGDGYFITEHKHCKHTPVRVPATPSEGAVGR
jgi:hypothetical protein